MSKTNDARLVASLILFFFGGASVSFEVFTALALMQGDRTILEQALGLQRFVALALVTLTLATLITQLDRLLWLGRTILIGGGFGLVQAAFVYLTVPERWDLTWQLGVPNALLVMGLGYWLNRLAGRRAAGREPSGDA